MSVEDDMNDATILGMASENQKFAIALGLVLEVGLQQAFERGIDGQWFTLVDVAPIAHAPQGQLMRVFRLTYAGLSRLMELSASQEIAKAREEASKKAMDFVNAEERISVNEGSAPCVACEKGTLQWFRFPEYGTCRIICTNRACVDIHQTRAAGTR